MADHSLELLKITDKFEFEAWLPNGEFIGSLEPILPEQTCRENPLVIVREGASAIPIDANAEPSRLAQVAVSSDGISAAMSVHCSRSNFSQIVKFDLENRTFLSVSAKGEYAGIPMATVLTKRAAAYLDTFASRREETRAGHVNP